MGRRTYSSTMLFVVSYSVCPIFIQNVNLNLTFWYFKLWFPLQKLVLAPGPTIGDNAVFKYLTEYI